MKSIDKYAVPVNANDNRKKLIAYQTSSAAVSGFISSPEPKAHGELIVYQSSCRLSVCPSTLSNMNISATSGLITTKFYLKHLWVGGKDALGFGPDRIRTLVSMATNSSHNVIMGKML